jgi:hypothetical protein
LTTGFLQGDYVAARRLSCDMQQCYPGRHRGWKLLSFPPFSLQQQRKGGAAPHRGNACAARRIADASEKAKNTTKIANASDSGETY